MQIESRIERVACRAQLPEIAVAGKFQHALPCRHDPRPSRRRGLRGCFGHGSADGWRAMAGNRGRGARGRGIVCINALIPAVAVDSTACRL
jgi:hypothetical protein